MRRFSPENQHVKCQRLSRLRKTESSNARPLAGLCHLNRHNDFTPLNLRYVCFSSQAKSFTLDFGQRVLARVGEQHNFIASGLLVQTLNFARQTIESLRYIQNYSIQ